MRLTAILLLFGMLGSGQIQDLATTDDGGQTYFSTAFRQKGTSQSGYSKIFRIAEDGLQYGRQTLANGPAALIWDGRPGAVLWKQGQAASLTFQGVPLTARTDANADRIVYEIAESNGNFELHSYSVASGADLLLITGGADGMIVGAVISGWGNVAFANSFGRLLRIDVATGEKTELIAAVPDLQVTFGEPAPGGRIDVTMTGPADGDPAILTAGAAPAVGRSDNVVTLQVPWEAPVEARYRGRLRPAPSLPSALCTRFRPGSRAPSTRMATCIPPMFYLPGSLREPSASTRLMS